MQLSNLPARILAAFAVSGSKRTIPVASQIGITPGAASFTDGFPPLTFQPLSLGGIPPAGQDFNGIFNAVTLIQQWQSAGGSFAYDAAWSTANNGYPKGACLARADGTGFWFNTTDNNTADPDGATPTGWVPEWQYGITAVTGLTNANVTLTSLQYGRPIITLAGTLTGNVQIIFPTLAALQWLVVNNTTGAFTVTAKTAAGTGVVIPQAQSLPVWGDGTNLNSSAPQGRLIGRRIITTTATYTPTVGTNSVDVTVVAGGGGGGGTAATGAGQCAAGAGGGGGGWAKKRITSGFSGVTATVGAAGSAGLAGGNGGSGGTSSFGALISATGGSGGSGGAAASSATVAANGAGAGGTGSSGDLNGGGGFGSYAIYAPNPVSGKGGFSLLGDGAGWVVGGFVGGNTASFPGAGGSGSAAAASNGAASGGAGAGGIIIIEEYA